MGRPRRRRWGLPPCLQGEWARDRLDWGLHCRRHECAVVDAERNGSAVLRHFVGEGRPCRCRRGLRRLRCRRPVKGPRCRRRFALGRSKAPGVWDQHDAGAGFPVRLRRRDRVLHDNQRGVGQGPRCCGRFDVQRDPCAAVRAERHSGSALDCLSRRGRREDLLRGCALPGP